MQFLCALLSFVVKMNFHRLRYTTAKRRPSLAFSRQLVSNQRRTGERANLMNMQTALRAFGVSDDTLTAADKQQLDEQGYLPLPGLLSTAQAEALRARFQELIQQEGDDAGLEVHQEAGTERLANLVDKDPLFEICFSQPQVLAAMNHVLQGDFKLSSLNGRASLPGEGHQALHADWSKGVDPSNYQVCNSIWLLVDFTPENGATRIVPGSHRSGQVPQAALDDPWAEHPEEALVTGKAGTVVIFNSHLWHSGTVNRTKSRRYALHSYFTRRHHTPQTNFQKLISQATLARLSPQARFILNV